MITREEFEKVKGDVGEIRINLEEAHKELIDYKKQEKKSKKEKEVKGRPSTPEEEAFLNMGFALKQVGRVIEDLKEENANLRKQLEERGE